MKAIMVEEVVRVISEPSDEALSVFSLKKGDVVETGKVIRKKKVSWVAVTLPGGQTGYISGQTRIFVIRLVELSAATDVMDAPTENPTVIKTLPKGAVVSAVGVEKNDSGTWYHITDDAGTDGYISSRAKYRMYQEPTVTGGTRLMITGGIFAGLGIVFLVSSFSQATTSSSLFLVVGLIGLGVVQVVQGFLQRRKAKAKKPE